MFCYSMRSRWAKVSLAVVVRSLIKSTAIKTWKIGIALKNLVIHVGGHNLILGNLENNENAAGKR